MRKLVAVIHTIVALSVGSMFMYPAVEGAKNAAGTLGDWIGFGFAVIGGFGAAVIAWWALWKVINEISSL